MAKYIEMWDEDPNGHQAQAQADRKGWKTTTTMVTGGEQQDALALAGPEVGNPYDEDEMGENRGRVTYRGKK